MLYPELLAQQDQEASKLHFDYRESRDQIKQMQKEHPNGNAKYNPQLERLENAFARDRDTLDKRHRQEQRAFLNEPELVQEKSKTKDMDNAYNKTVSVKIDSLKEEIKEARIERKMREWDQEQVEKTKQRDRTRERER